MIGGVWTYSGWGTIRSTGQQKSHERQLITVECIKRLGVRRYNLASIHYLRSRNEAAKLERLSARGKLVSWTARSKLKTT